MKSSTLLQGFPGIIKRGSKNSVAVIAIKSKLMAKGYGTFDLKNVTFGPTTEEAVKKFQRRNNLLDDGIVGDLTWKRLNYSIGLDVNAIQESGPSKKLSLRALEIMKTQLYMREITGKNDSPEIDVYLKSVGAPKGSAYCMALVYWAFSEAAKEQGKVNPLVKTGGVLNQWNKQPKNVKFSKPEKGAIFIMDFGKGKGHCGMVDDAYLDRIHTIEGNTSSDPSLPAKDREGNGNFERSRKLSAINKGYLIFEI